MCVSVYAHLFLRQIIYLSSPLPPLTLFPFPHPFKQPLGVLVRFKVWTLISLPEETLYLVQLYRVGGNILVLILPTQPQKVTHSASDTVFMGQSSRRGPASLQAYCFGGLCRETRHYIGSVLSLRVQREYKRFWIDILGASLIHRTHWDIYHVGSKGQGGFSSVGQLTFVKHWCACSS